MKLTIIKYTIIFIITFTALYCQDTTSFYPLQVGNKWYYYGYSTHEEILSDTLINNLKYFIRTDFGDNLFYERYDQTDSTICRYNINADTEKRSFSFKSINDSVIYINGFNNKKYKVQSEYLEYFFSKIRKIRSFRVESGLIRHDGGILFAEGIGMINEAYFYHGGSGWDKSLIGCVINGKHYGNTTDIESQIIENYLLNLTNYPNPFNNSTKIKYSIPKTSLVKISIFDLQGRNIQTILNKKIIKGKYEINWNTSCLNSGVYFIRIKTNDNFIVKKCSLLK